MGITHFDEADREVAAHGHLRSTWTYLGNSAGCVDVGASRIQVADGGWSTPAHEHGAGEEIVLGEEEIPVREGAVVGRPAGTGVAHTFRAGERGLQFLAYGTRDKSDICYYPRSNKIAFRSVGVIARLEQLDYWDGED